MYDVFKQDFMKKHGLDLDENFRAKLKMFDAIEKLRKRLTANKEADIEVDSLMDDQDFRKTIQRQDFEAMIQPVLLALKSIMEQALQFAGLQSS